MKKFISRVKKATKDFFTNKSAFSLVELIVVIAIMAVMAAVLAPALLGYVEKSRMQKDDSAMDEVVNAVQLSLADQSIYDEVLEHSVWDNVSCYIDKKDESQFTDCKVQLKAANGDKKEQYMFGDEARLLDETVYYAAGNMRGLTITWSPSESGDTYDFANGILNKFVGRKTGLLSENPELYNRLRSVIGDKLDTTSQTYRNSDYTIFIRVGSTGGSEAVMQDAIQVWGQFNGTNLTEKDHKYELSSGRVVGAAGANDTTNNQKQNETNNDEVFSEDYIAPKVYTQWTPIEWDGLTSFYASDIWTDGTYTYYSNGKKQYVLDGNTWKPKTWNNFNPTGQNVWTDGNKWYFSNNSVHYVLNGNTWTKTTWNGLSRFAGKNVWAYDNNIYYLEEGAGYILNGDTWNAIQWDVSSVGGAIVNFSGYNVWTYKTDVYVFPGSSHQYMLDGNVWIRKKWQGFESGTSYSGDNIWTDGTNIYHSQHSKHVVLNKQTNAWEPKTWSGLTIFDGDYIWTDGTNYYYSNGSQQYVLS